MRDVAMRRKGSRRGPGSANRAPPGPQVGPSLLGNVVQHLVERRIAVEQLAGGGAGLAPGEAGVFREKHDVARDVLREIQAAFVAHAVEARALLVTGRRVIAEG